MSVTVDHQPLPTETLGLKTVGQVLAHLQRQDRLVIHVLIDGQEPDLNQLGKIKQATINGHTLFIETAEPRRMAMDVLEEVESQLDEADRLKTDAVDLIQKGNGVRAMQKLSGCFSTWQHAQESIQKTARLLRIDMSRILIDGKPFTDILNGFGEQLRSIKTSLENRDFVSLCDTLTYESTETSKLWRAALQSIPSIIE
jgi:hypothetical protein